MTPVDQEFVSDPSIGQYGDCQRAVVASLLDLPIAEVPHFLQLAKGDPSDFWERIQEFVGARGFIYVTLHTSIRPIAFGSDVDVYHGISGPSPRGNGLYHAVVGKNGSIEFDPHASRAGLVGDPKKWTFDYLVKL